MTRTALVNDLKRVRKHEGTALLVPGEIACAALDVTQPESRILRRMFGT